MDGCEWIRTTSSPQAIASWCHDEFLTRCLAVDRPAGPAVHRQGEERTRLPQRVAPHSPRQGEEREPQGEAYLLPGVHHLLPLPHPGYHRGRAHVLLPPQSAPGVPGHEGPSAVSYTHLRAHETRHDLV